MIVLDANILIRAVLGRRVRQLIETYGVRGARFFAPDVAFGDAASYLPPLLEKRGKQDVDVPVSLEYLRHIIEPQLRKKKTVTMWRRWQERFLARSHFTATFVK